MQSSESQVVNDADWSDIRYALCWEDADILLEALDVQPGDTCLSIASAGDNTLSLLTREPAEVIAVDLSAAQIACLEMRVAAYRELSHGELLELLGETPSERRRELYQRIRKHLSPGTAALWDARPRAVEKGFGTVGKFEKYLFAFGRYVMPFIHGRRCVETLFARHGLKERTSFYDRHWNSLAWRALFRIFFSRAFMGRFGRDPRFFQYVEGTVADRILARARHALAELDPYDNAYMQRIFLGRCVSALPHSLRPEHYDSIRTNLHRLHWHVASAEGYLAGAGDETIDRYNMSDVFEYVSEPSYVELLRAIVRTGRPGARLAYWNMLAPRRRPEALASQLRPLDELAQRLYRADKTCFYSAFVVEEVC